MRYQKLVTHIESHSDMQQKRNESAQEQRIALYKSKHHHLSHRQTDRFFCQQIDFFQFRSGDKPTDCWCVCLFCVKRWFDRIQTRKGSKEHLFIYCLIGFTAILAVSDGWCVCSVLKGLIGFTPVLAVSDCWCVSLFCVKRLFDRIQTRKGFFFKEAYLFIV